jgi:hypothetical protein
VDSIFSGILCPAIHLLHASQICTNMLAPELDSPNLIIMPKYMNKQEYIEQFLEIYHTNLTIAKMNQLVAGVVPLDASTPTDSWSFSSPTPDE